MSKQIALRRCLLVLAAVAAALTAAGTASARTPDPQLLQAYQPVTVFDPAERFRPTTVQSFISDADLERFEGGSWTVVATDPEPGQLPGPGTGTWRLNQDSCTPSGPLGGLSCYAEAAATGGNKSIVYGRVVHVADAIVLQYWFFYYDDVYSYFYPPSDAVWQAHEGDWEVVNVVLSADEHPVEVGYSQHCLGQIRTWDSAPRIDDTHPVVYVAAGSHANYPTPGLHQFDVRCIPLPVLDLLMQHGLAIPVDYTTAGDFAGPRSAGGEVTTIRHVDEETPPWISFPGLWGEDQFFHSPFTGTVTLGTSPDGPAFHDVWNDPLGTLATWSVG
jgi:hypothetical protein